ncbi:serine acetyltransferase [Shewanella colwelliana]|nr:serine acetyltransferase [Shewanella colwelliana]
MNPVKFQSVAHKLYNARVPFIPYLITAFIRVFFGCYFSHKTRVGKQLLLGYKGLGIVIHDRVIVGDYCHIDQNVTIGGTSKKYNVPTLGTSVYVGAGAKVLGPISIGDNVVIGANSVVVKDIPDNCLVVGVPARIIKTNISKSDYV